MIETTVLNYLKSALDDVTVLMELPEVPSADYPSFPEKLVVVELVGRRVTDRLQRASIALQSYGTTLYNAALLDEQVRAAMDAIPGSTDVAGAHLASNYNFTDPETKRYRYQSVFELYFV